MCAKHEPETWRREGLAHGFVTGEIPRRKLVEFLEREVALEEHVARSAVGDELCKQGKQPRVPRSSPLWYARYHFWHEALKLDTPQRRLQHGGQINDVSDLTEQERRVCLHRVHEYFRKSRHLAWQGGRGRGFVEKGKGPGLDADTRDEAFD